jgi:DNA polymerase III epsilon subunit-like protein
MSISEKEINELDAVLLKDGREAVILELFRKPGEKPAFAFLVEILDDEKDFFEVTLDQIERIIWKR